MGWYVFKRLLLIVPTLVGVVAINFFIVQLAPGGPVDQMIGRITGENTGQSTARIAGAAPMPGAVVLDPGARSQFQGAQALDPKLIEAIEKQFGFDKPIHERFFIMLWDYAQLDLGDSFFEKRPVITLIIEALPVSISLGLWSTLLIYMISIPLGVAKARRNGTRFDTWTSGIILVGYAVPAFLLAVFLILLFAGGSYFSWFPLKGLTSNNFETLSLTGKIFDYFWHLVLPVIAMTIGGFATLTMLTKNSFLDEISKQYVLTARAKGLEERQIMFGHVFRNAMLIVIAGFPAALVGILFTGSLLVEVIFSLEGLGLLGFEAIVKRDYPVIFGTLFFFTFIGLVMTLIGDLMYVLVDPRIDFETREV